MLQIGNKLRQASNAVTLDLAFDLDLDPLPHAGRPNGGVMQGVGGTALVTPERRSEGFSP